MGDGLTIWNDITRAGVIFGGVFYQGFKWYGIGIGCDEFVANFLNQKVAGRTLRKWPTRAASCWRGICGIFSPHQSDMRMAILRLDTKLWWMLEADLDCEVICCQKTHLQLVRTGQYGKKFI